MACYHFTTRLIRYSQVSSTGKMFPGGNGTPIQGLVLQGWTSSAIVSTASTIVPETSLSALSISPTGDEAWLLNAVAASIYSGCDTGLLDLDSAAASAARFSAAAVYPRKRCRDVRRLKQGCNEELPHSQYLQAACIPWSILATSWHAHWAVTSTCAFSIVTKAVAGEFAALPMAIASLKPNLECASMPVPSKLVAQSGSRKFRLGCKLLDGKAAEAFCNSSSIKGWLEAEERWQSASSSGRSPSASDTRAHLSLSQFDVGRLRGRLLPSESRISSESRRGISFSCRTCCTSKLHCASIVSLQEDLERRRAELEADDNEDVSQ